MSSEIFKPHNYQTYCIGREITDPALALFLDMGLGKTIITLTALNDLKYNRFAAYKILIIAPKRVAEDTWSTEAAKWRHTENLRVVPVLGSAAKRIKALATPADIWVTNRENTQWIVDYYSNDWPFDTVVLDEFSSFKSHAAKRFKALKAIRGHIHRIIGLTGTPAPNGLMDLWAQIYLLDQGERLGKTITGFRERYFDYNPYSRVYTPKDGAEQAIQAKISDICISMKAEDYLELPECLTVDVPVRLSLAAQKTYDKLETEAILQIDGEEINAGSAAVLGGKLLQLCNGAVYDEDHKVHEIHEDKIEAFMELIEGLNGAPVLVAYNFKHDLDRLLAALKPTGLRVAVLHGPKEIEAWNSHKLDVLLAHPASAGYGLNLQAGGNHIIWFSLIWALEQYQQFNARLHRQGQRERVIIHRLLVQGGMDEDVRDALASKAGLQDGLMNALKARIDRVKGRTEGVA